MRRLTEGLEVLDGHTTVGGRARVGGVCVDEWNAFGLYVWGLTLVAGVRAYVGGRVSFWLVLLGRGADGASLLQAEL